MIFFDFEVFQYDWMVCYADTDASVKDCIVNDPEALRNFYEGHKREIWSGFNVNHYDQYILKGILLGYDPKEINDWIIRDDQPGWMFSNKFNQVFLITYDIMLNNDRGLKVFEGFMGNNIKETSVPFDIQRELTPDEIEETKKYCFNDVEQAMEVFIQRKGEFEARLDLVKLACEGKRLDLTLLSRTKPQLSAIILGATKQQHHDEFDINFPDTLRLEKYAYVKDWYADENHHRYATHVEGRKTAVKMQLETIVAGCPHVFAWGGVHGALEKYSGEGYYLMADVASLYPSLMIRYNLHSRNMKDPQKYVDIYHERLRLKKAGDPLNKVLKLVLNSTYGVMKDKNNDLWDPRQANRVCVYGQLLILDLIEHLEKTVPGLQLIQSNTDGILIRMQHKEDYWLIDDVCAEWEERTGLTLEFEEYRKVYQKDVNNYVIIGYDGHWKSKGAYVKDLSNLDYDLPIVNHALVDYMVKGIPVEETIESCNDLKEFQLVAKASGKYLYILHGDERLNESCIRIFASRRDSDQGVKKVSARTGKPEKISNSPEHSFIFNENVNGVPVPAYLDKKWYINMARKRLKDFGI